MMNQNRINNKQILSAEEMKNKMIKINNSFNNYIKSLTKDFDEDPNSYKNSCKYSSELIDEFNQFYDNFNLLREELITKNNQNPQNINMEPKERETVVIDNIIVKDLKDSFTKKNINLANSINENRNRLSKINDDLNKILGPFAKK